MRIDGIRPVQPNSSGKRTERAAGGFSISEPGHAARAGNVGGVNAMVGIDGLMALQAEDGPLERRRRAVNKGKATLDVLDSLKLAILEGRGGAGAAQQLAGLTQNVEPTGEPGLDSTLQEISVRAAVELAKLRLRQTPS